MPLLVNAVRILPLSFSANGYLDDASPMRAFVKVPAEVTSVSEAAVTLAFRQFMAPATTVPSGGGSTSGSSASGVNVSTEQHSHAVTTGVSGAASAGTAHTHGPGTYDTALTSLPTAAVVSLNNHTHTTPAHTHSLTYGTYEETYPASHSVKLKVYRRFTDGAGTSTWTLLHTSASQTADLVDLDLTAYITTGGDYRLEVLSDAAQPNGGRLGLDLFGTLELVI